ncbi:MAG: IclR family transcriptional regulator [Clostridiales bacterium]|nr:IclR family transcriptional regulator [Clostridiales bacterium]
MDEYKEKKSIASVHKAVKILEVIAASRDGLGVTEISQQLDYGVSASYHLLNTLKQCGMVAQDKRTKKYYIGYTLFRLAGQAKDQNLLGSMAMQHLNRLKEEVHETCNLSMMNGIYAICVAQSESQHMLRMFSRPGASSQFYFTASGKLLISLQPRESWNAVIEKLSFEKYTENTILTADALVCELEITRKRGYGIDNEEREEGVFCIAAPIFDCYGEAVAAMSISGPVHRVKERADEIAHKIILATAEFSRCIGGPQ